MSDAFDEAQELLQCKSCPWYKNCVTPIRVTEEDLRRQLETMPGRSTSVSPHEISQLLATMASAVQNALLEGCPVFINRLRNNPKLAEEMKKIMQGWSAQEQL